MLRFIIAFILLAVLAVAAYEYSVYLKRQAQAEAIVDRVIGDIIDEHQQKLLESVYGK